MPIKRLAICLLFICGIIFNSQVFAWIVPWTIQKASGTSSALQCNTSNSTAYRTSYSCTETNSCATYELDRSASCGCESYKQETDYGNCLKTWTPTCKSYGTKNGTTCLERNNDATCKEYVTQKVQRCTMRWRPGWSARCNGSFDTLVWESCADIYGMSPAWCSWMSSIVEKQTWSCKSYNNDATCKRYNQVTDYGNCTSYNDAACIQYGTKNSTTCAQYNQCRSSSHSCETYETTPSFSTSTYKNMEPNDARPTLSSLYNLPNGYTYYNNEGNNSCYVAVNGSDHNSASWNTQTKCSTTNSYYYSSAWSNGSCNVSSAKNYLITSYDQTWYVKTATPGITQNKCSVEWRIAVKDTVWPSVSIISKNFTNDQTKWCNLNKYKWLDGFSTYWDEKSPTTEGCEYYKNLSSFSWNNPDIISDVQITITDNSAISKVNIEIWTCSANISLTTDLSKLENNGNGVKPEVQSLIVYWHKASSYAGESVASLKNLFGVNRLDDCLGNGRNYIKVTAKDNSRNSSDVTKLDSNTNIVSTSTTQFINIDNLGVSFGVDEKSTPTSKSTWYDKTVSGTFKFEDLTDSWDPICKAYEKGTQKFCTDKPNNSYWSSPTGINKNTWEHYTYTCDGEPLSVNGCDWTCEPWFEKKDGKCEPIVTQTTCWTLWISRLGFDTTLCNYTPIYSWHSKKDTVCNGSFYMQSSVCKDQYGKLASKDMCKDPEPSTTVPCSIEKQWFTIGRDTIWDDSKTIWK